jgi:hypothetical protein
VLEVEQDRIVWDTGLAKPSGSGGSLGTTHCHQRLHAKVTARRREHLESDDAEMEGVLASLRAVVGVTGFSSAG